MARYTQSVLGFTGEDAVNFFPPAPEPLQSTQTDKQFFGRGEAVWSLFDGRFKNFFGVNYTNEWSHNVDPNPDSFTAPPAVAPPTTNLGQRTQVDWRGEARVIPGQTFVFGLEDKKETLTPIQPVPSTPPGSLRRLRLTQAPETKRRGLNCSRNFGTGSLSSRTSATTTTRVSGRTRHGGSPRHTSSPGQRPS